MKRLSVFVYLLLSSSLASAADFEQEIKACDQAFQNGNFTQAITHAEQALKDAPDNRDAYLCMGRAQGEAGQHADAVIALEAADKHSINPADHIIALTLLGNQYRSVQEYTSALVAYRKSLAISEKGNNRLYAHINHNQLGETLQSSGDLENALQHFQQGMNLAANDNERADSNARVAAAYSLMGNHDKAIEHQLKSMLQEKRIGDLDHYANASIELGRICFVAKEYADAEKWLGKFLEIISQSQAPYWEAKGRFMLGKVKAAQGKSSEAAEQFSRAKALAEESGSPQLLKEIASAEAAA